VRRGWLIFVACFWLAALKTSYAAPDDSPDTSLVRDDPAVAQDILLLGPTHPLRIRLHIDISGVPFHEAWRKTVQAGFDRFDTSKKGRISSDDAAKLIAMFTSGMPGEAKPPSVAAVMAMMKAAPELTIDDVLARLQKTAPPLAVRNRLASRGAGPALFSLLDTDGDGRLSREELAAAEANLRCRDFNDDGLITAEELILGPPRGGEDRAGGAAGAAASDGPVVAITPTTTPDALVDVLLMRYDRNRDGKLSFGKSAPEIRSPAIPFEKWDADHDGLLDRAELTVYLASPPEIEMPFSLGRTRHTTRPAAEQTGEAAAFYHVRPKLDGGYRLTVAENEIDFRRNNRDPAQSQASQAPSFSDYDQNKDGVLSGDELNAAGLTANLALVDTNGDGKVTPEEFDAYQRWQAQAAGVQLVLEVTDEGQDLFSLLDRNGDGFLSPREMKTAAEILKTESADHEHLTSGDISYHIMLELSRGGSAASSNNPAAEPPARQPRKPKASAPAPDWFSKMDRNGDGEVSIEEFLGSREQFDKLDLNHDGLIDAAEAAAASVASK
jgi:Ca2+-binding EF-hand superfamily protein